MSSEMWPMPQGLQHRVVLVGLSPDRPAVEAALRGRAGELADAADLDGALREAAARPGEPLLFLVAVPPGGAAGLARLTAAAPGQPVIALLPPGADLAALLAAQRAGAAQVLPLPVHGDDLGQALDRVQAQFAPPPRAGLVIAVCGVSGGCGGTTLALNLACELGQGVLGPGRGGCVLVELTRQMGTLATYLDVQPKVTTPELLADASRLSSRGVRQALTSVTPGLDVLVGPYQDLAPGGLSSRHLHSFVNLCRRLAGAVVLDVPCAFDDWQFEAMALADHVVLVGVQSVSSVRTLKLVRDALLREEGVVRPVLVVNRYEPGVPGFAAPRLASLLGAERIWTVTNDYPSVMAANNHGKPLRLAAPHSPVLADVRALAQALAGPAAPAAAGDRLERALGRGASAHDRRIVRVLHVEDDEVQQEAVALYLTAARELVCQVTAVASEAEAVAAFARGGIDLVLLDFHLSQGDGLACLRQLRARDAVVPIIVVSGLEEPQVAARLLEAGADDFLSKKNFSGPQLARAVAAAVARADALRAIGGAAPAGPAVTPDQQELLRAVAEVRRGLPAGGARPERVERLAEAVASELGADRRAVLTLLLRLFGEGG